MKKNLIFILSGIVLFSCKQNKIETTSNDPSVYAKSITAEDLKKHLYIFASDDFEGRNTGEAGQKKAAKYLKDFYISQNINAPENEADYYQDVPKSFLPKGLNDSENVVAFIKGKKKPEEILVLSAHYDHVGMENGQVFNGADDDGSGTVTLLEIAQAFKMAENKGNGPDRSILFLSVTAEEKGLYGSKWYTENPLFPMENHIANLNIDMIGRTDDLHKDNENYIYLIGSDKLSTELHNVSEAVHKKYSDLGLDYRFNDEDDPNRFYYRSDHYNFAKNGVPVIFYFNGVHEDYHQPTDTPDKINYPLLQKRARLIFHTAWELANREDRIVVDKK